MTEPKQMTAGQALNVVGTNHAIFFTEVTEVDREALSVLRRVVEENERLVSPNWKPTAEFINALPELVKEYICRIETLSDPAGLVRENALARDTIKAQEIEIEELKAKLARLKAPVTEEEPKEMLDALDVAWGKLPNGVRYFPMQYARIRALIVEEE